MALKAVPDHPKFSRLKVLLRLNKYRAVGLLEMVWHFTSLYTPMDLVILPATSSRMKQARNISVPVLAHPLMVLDGRCLRAVVEALRG